MRAAVVIGFLKTAGGSESLALDLMRLLRNIGYDVDVITLGPIDRRKIHEWTGIDLNALVRDEIVVFPHYSPISTIYSSYLSWINRDLITFPCVRKRYDLTITALELMPVVFTDIIYIHSIDRWIMHPYNIAYGKYARNGFLAGYSRPYWRLAELGIKAFKRMSRKPIVVTNSSYSAKLIARYLDVKPFVIYPPVHVREYQTLCRSGDRGDIVLTICRFDQGKSLRTVIDVARQVKTNARFVILGSAWTQEAQEYERALISEARESGVERKLSVVVNATARQKAAWLSRSKILLHPTRGEHFGIAIVEGMAAGLVPVLHKSGGAWTDIAEHGRYALGFDESCEAASAIDELLTNDDFYERSRKLAMDRSFHFSEEKFQERFTDLIRKHQNIRARTD